MPPIRAFQELPPLAPVAHIDRMRWRREYQRARIQHMRQRSGIIFSLWRNLSEGNVTGRLHEFLELPVGDGCRIDPEVADGHAVYRRLLRIMPVGAHAERTAGNGDHAVSRAIDGGL